MMAKKRLLMQPIKGRISGQKKSIIVDLVTAESINHQDFYMKFFLHTTPKGSKWGCPGSDYVSAAVEEIYLFLESNNECQCSFSELRVAVTWCVPEDNPINAKLIGKIGERIIITTRR